MIARNVLKSQIEPFELSWQQLLAQGISNPQELLAAVAIDPRLFLKNGALAQQQFPTRVPHGFVRRMRRGDINDPLLRQVLPVAEEMMPFPLFTLDPLQEKAVNPVPGLLHKYQGRVLLTLTGGCAIHCRYCFRRHFPYQANNPGRRGWQEVIAYIQNDPSITEVIYSGGDPLLLTDDYLTELTTAIASIPHVTTLRIHTRIPIVLPERLDASFLRFCENIPLHKVMVVHCNHPQEIDASVKQALSPLRALGITLLNQTVLLKGINDAHDTLVALSHALFDAGILPYYLHLLDKVQGAAHFDVPEQTAKQLMMEMMVRLPGYLVPKLVKEIGGAASKIAVFS